MTRGRPRWAAVPAASAVAGALLAVGGPGALSARQDTTPAVPGVELGMAYEARSPHVLVVPPFAGPQEEETPPEAEAARLIIARDLELSGRFSLLEAPPAPSGGRPDLASWDGLGVDYVVDGRFLEARDESVLRITIRDALYPAAVEEGVFLLPRSGSGGFRMAVHRVSDAVVRWITGEPGMAASRIAFMRRREDGGTDLVVVDADGEALRRVATAEATAFSPAWSPDGSRIVHTALSAEGTYEVLERDLVTGGTRALTPAPGLNLTPAYAPDGSRLALSISTGFSEDLHEVDLGSGALHRIQARAMSPAYSRDGRYLAFASDRLGRPRVWILDRQGGEPELVSPPAGDEPADFELPDWSPTGPVLAFHGGSGLAYQVLVVDVTDPRRRVRQVTREGWSESPSWAPDGRHLVVHGVRDGRPGLYVLDAGTGRTRLLVPGADVRTPDWSPALGPGSGG